MNKLRIFQNLFVILLGMMCCFTSCQENELAVPAVEQDVPEGYVAVSFKAQIPDMNKVQVRAVDPDGLDVHNMKLFCFNTYGLFITVAYATDFQANNDSHTGTFDAVIPSETTIIHFVANQNIGQYELADFAGKSEAEVLSAMEGGSGMMIYWGRFEKDADNTNDIKAQLAALTNGVTLIRNQAKVSIVKTETVDNQITTVDSWENDYFTVSGFRTANIHAFGTVAPYCPTHGFEITQWPNDHLSVTLPVNKAMMSDIVDVNTAMADYIFEHENTLDNPVSVIIKGRNKSGTITDELYYRVLLQDDNGEPLKILRNHHYQINIVGTLSYGQVSFEDALNAPATNNVWVAVDDWVKEISDGTNKLGVEETHIVLDEKTYAGKPYTFKYTATAKPIVTWVDGNNVAEQTITVSDLTAGEGEISVNLLAMASSVNQQSGTLMLKLGKMYRKVNITVVKTMSFTPSWVSSNVHKEAGENVTLKFTVPEDCPEGLFPFPVMISVNDLDVRAASGMQLPVRTQDEVEWYGEVDNGLGYKYEYIIEAPGVHRLYFSTVLPHAVAETEDITLEAEFFSSLTKKVNFSETEYEISLPVYNETNRVNGFHTFNAATGSTYQLDEPIYYLLVPQKKGASVTFDVDLRMRGEKQSDGTYAYTSKSANAADEFFLFSKTLELREGTGYTFGANYGEIDASASSTSASNGRTILFYPTENTTPSTFTLNAVTKTSKSADVVRLSSNKATSYSAKDQTTGNYTGDEYRSAIFEFANYRPFGFEAKVKVGDSGEIGTWGVNNSYGEDPTSSFVEPIDNVQMTYQPNQTVEISFNLNTFIGSDNKTVSPLGREFEIYIDAPMLQLGNTSSLPIVEDENKKGHFIYTVAADATAGVINIPFVKNSICSAGEITLSSQEEEVVFYKKTFKVSNEEISGTIKYNDGSGDKDVPKDAFVAFVRNKTNSRIGVMTITANGVYSLNLRSEYVFDWTDEITLNYKHTDGKYYEFQTTLSELFTTPNVVLLLETTTP